MGDVPALHGEAAHFLVHIARALMAGFAREGGEQRIAVEPSFAAPSERAQRHIGCVQPAEFFSERRGVHERHIRAVLLLQQVRAAQFRGCRGSREIEIALLAQGDGWFFIADGQFVGGTAQKSDAGLRDADVCRGGELLANGCGRQGRGGKLVGRVTLDDNHAGAGAEPG
jgi:hypothetical protein